MLTEKPVLSPQEQKVHVELLQLAGGVACMKELNALNDEQREVLKFLREKGYVSLTKRKFMVVFGG